MDVVESVVGIHFVLPPMIGAAGFSRGSPIGSSSIVGRDIFSERLKITYCEIKDFAHD